MTFIKAQRLKWWSHLYMEEYKTVRSIFEWSPMGKRPTERPRNRWTVEVLKDIRVLGVKYWKNVAMCRSGEVENLKRVVGQ